MDYWDAHWRAYHAVETLRAWSHTNGYRQIGIVAHEGVIRSMSGIISLGNAKPVDLSVRCPVVKPASHHFRNADNTGHGVQFPGESSNK